MLGFPKPYPQELLYSTLARSGAHYGETSPKQLLDSVFGDRSVIATVDLPSHIGSISNQYPESLGITSIELINNHTLWPIYAPFIPYVRRSEIEERMCGSSFGSVHLASGIAASRIKHKQSLFMCLECMEEQRDAYGESYWDRRWQAPLVIVCPKHGPLYQSNAVINGAHRHEFMTVSDAVALSPKESTDSDFRLSCLIDELFLGVPLRSPSFDQWTQFYRDFAFKCEYSLGKRIDHKAIQGKYLKYWGIDWLEKSNLLPSDKDTSWLKSIFRRHRKSFSFAEHLTVIDSLSNGQLRIVNTIQSALSYPVTIKKKQPSITIEIQNMNADQINWLSLLEVYTPKLARKQNPALYARLYRNYYTWLMQVDAAHHIENKHASNRVNWQQRDREIAKKIMGICFSIEENMYLPRLSKSYLLHQLTISATIEKNLHRLPRCKVLLEKYSENIAEYQARRLTNAVIALRNQSREIKDWVLIREAGLSKDRMKGEVVYLLKEILKNARKGQI